MASPGSAAIVTFADFEAKPSSRELCRNGVRVRLPDQSFQILSMLLERPGELVTREEICKRLWPGDTFVDFDHGLNNAVNRLREALGDSAENPRFIETLPRRGYRFIEPVQACSAQGNVPSVTPSAKDIRATEYETAAVTNVSEIPTAAADPKRPVIANRFFVAALMALVLAGGSAGLLSIRGRTQAPRIQSLAVLPLENVTGDPGQDFFADGMTDALITRLAGLSSVRVISRTSAMHYKGSAKLLSEIANDLNVDAVVEGTVSKAGNRVRINAQLVDARSDRHLWARQYDSELEDILQLQNELASSIAKEVAGRVDPNQASRFAAQARRVNPQAYEALLKGEYFLDKWTTDGFEKAKNYYEESIKLDPTYADGYAGLGEYYATVAFMGIVPPRKAWLKAEELLSKAVEIDDTSSKAHTELGMLKFFFRCDRVGAEKELNRALELNPADMRALDYHSYYLLETGRADEAIAEKKRVLEHDPLRVATSADLGLYLLQAERTDEAIAQLHKTLELDSNYAAAHMRLGLAYARKLQYAQAVIEMRKAISLDDEPARLADLGAVYGHWGKKQEAVETLRRLEQMSTHRYVSPAMRAVIYAALGEKETAFEWLAKARADEVPPLSDSGFDGLRSDPRFKTIEARLRAQSCPAR